MRKIITAVSITLFLTGAATIDSTMLAAVPVLAGAMGVYVANA